jgi:hypothetical protein
MKIRKFQFRKGILGPTPLHTRCQVRLKFFYLQLIFVVILPETLCSNLPVSLHLYTDNSLARQDYS